MSLPKISHPLFEVLIPSKDKRIQIKQMLAKDEKILLMAKTVEDPVEQQVEIIKAIRQVVNNSIVTPGVDVNSLTLFDIEWLFIKLRQYSVTNKIDNNYDDYEEMQDWTKKLEEANDPYLQNPNLKPKIPRPEPHKVTIDLEMLTIKWPEDRNNKIKVDGAITLELKYPDASLYAEEDFLKSNGPDMIMILIRNSIKAIHDSDKVLDPKDFTSQELTDFLNELPIGIYDKIQTYLNNMPHVYYEIKYTNKLGNERTIVLSKLSDFFSF